MQMQASTCLEHYLRHSICTQACDQPLPGSFSNKTVSHLQEESDQSRPGVQQTSVPTTDLLPPYLQEVTVGLLE